MSDRTILQDAQLLAMLLPSFRNEQVKSVIVSTLIELLIAALRDPRYADR